MSPRDWMSIEAELHIFYQWHHNLKGIIRSSNRLLTKVKQDFPGNCEKSPIFEPLFTNIVLVGTAPICVIIKKENGMDVSALPSKVYNVTITTDSSQQIYQTYPHSQVQHQPVFHKPPSITFPQWTLQEKSTQFCQECPNTLSTQNSWFQPTDYTHVCKSPISVLQKNGFYWNKLKILFFGENRNKGANQSHTSCTQILVGMTISTSDLSMSAASGFSIPIFTPLIWF